jgi:DnaJ-class molecular chaperone
VHSSDLQDYEALGLPMGSSKADVKKAYRKLAMQVCNFIAKQ